MKKKQYIAAWKRIGSPDFCSIIIGGKHYEGSNQLEGEDLVLVIDSFTEQNKRTYWRIFDLDKVEGLCAIQVAGSKVGERWVHLNPQIAPSIDETTPGPAK